MDIKPNIVESMAHDTSHDGKIVCSECGMELRSSHEWVRGDNDKVLCIWCYKDYMFPHLDENYMEIFD